METNTAHHPTTTDYLNTRWEAQRRANAEWIALNAAAPAWVHNRINAEAERIDNLQESLADTYAEYRGEVARYGDAWPGAHAQLDDMEDAIADAEARYDEVVADAVAFGYTPYGDFVPARTWEIYSELTADWAPEPF
jgi:hypothetical protein